MDKTFFYIIQRDGQIHEIEFTNERFTSAVDQWQKGGLIIFTSLGIGINAVDVKNVLNENNYKNYIDSAQPKVFVLKGSWYEIKDRANPIRNEKWKQDYLDSIKKISIGTPSKIATPEYIRKIKQELVDMKIINMKIIIN